MEVIQSIQPILFTALVGVVIAYARYVNTLKTGVAVMEKTIEDLLKTVEAMQKRLDSHSKKQDEIYNTLTGMKVEMIKEMGQITASVSSLASDIKGLSQLLAITDMGISIKRQWK